MDDTIFNLATEVLDAAKDGLSSVCALEPIRTYVTAGAEVAWDHCCDGQLTVLVTRIFGSTRFPSDAAAEPVQCALPTTAIEMSVTMLRCVPSLNDDGTPPTVEDMTTSAQQILGESRAIWKGVLCFLFEGISTNRFDAVVRGQEFPGPSGGFGGSQLNITIGLTDGCVCD